MPGIAGETWLEAAVRRLSQAINGFVYGSGAAPSNGDKLTYNSMLGAWIPGGASVPTFYYFASNSWAQNQFVGQIYQSGTVAQNTAPPLYGPSSAGQKLTRLVLMIPTTDASDQTVTIFKGTDLDSGSVATAAVATVVAGQRQAEWTGSIDLIAAEYLWAVLTSPAGIGVRIQGAVVIE